MATLLDDADRAALRQRLGRLHPATPARWGTLTAPRMLCHLADALRIALGEAAVTRIDTLPRRTLLKWLVVYTPLRPPPGKIETAPEMLASAPSAWAQDLAAVDALLERAGSRATAAVHPFFGPLTRGGWGRLGWKHVDHHLRQFGC